jgi:uncharacterized membrane protein YfcA
VIEPWLYPVLTGVAFVAGFIDAIAGGGGLIIMPALLVSGVPPLQALGTNKLQSMCGTFVAMRNYGAKGLIDWRPNLATALIVFAGSAGGAILVQYVEARTLALVIPLLLLANAVYILVSPRMSDEDAYQRVSAASYAPVGGAIGLYDGFFGPGTGSFFTSTLVALRGYGLTRATALCKFFNWTSNVAAVLLFAIGGKVLWLLGASMAVGAMAGGWLGSHTAMRLGAKLIRPLLITASVAMTARLLWGYFAA